MYKAVTNETRLHIDEAIVKVSLLIQSHWTTSAVFWLHSLEVPWDGGKKECIFAFFFFFFSFQVTTLLRDSGVLCSNRPVWSMNDLTAALKQKCRQKNICRKIQRNLRRGCFFVGYTVTSWHSQTIINLIINYLIINTNYSLYFPFVFLSVAVMQCVFVCLCVVVGPRRLRHTAPNWKRWKRGCFQHAAQPPTLHMLIFFTKEFVSAAVEPPESDSNMNSTETSPTNYSDLRLQSPRSRFLLNVVIRSPRLNRKLVSK